MSDEYKKFEDFIKDMEKDEEQQRLEKAIQKKNLEISKEIDSYVSNIARGLIGNEFHFNYFWGDGEYRNWQRDGDSYSECKAYYVDLDSEKVKVMMRNFGKKNSEYGSLLPQHILLGIRRVKFYEHDGIYNERPSYRPAEREIDVVEVRFKLNVFIDDGDVHWDNQ